MEGEWIVLFPYTLPIAILNSLTVKCLCACVLIKMLVYFCQNESLLAASSIFPPFVLWLLNPFLPTRCLIFIHEYLVLSEPPGAAVYDLMEFTQKWQCLFICSFQLALWLTSIWCFGLGSKPRGINMHFCYVQLSPWAVCDQKSMALLTQMLYLSQSN